MYYKVVATRPIRNKAIPGSVFGNNNIVGNSRLEFIMASDLDLKEVMKQTWKELRGWVVNVTAVTESVYNQFQEKIDV
jgi:hypothetical protein